MGAGLEGTRLNIEAVDGEDNATTVDLRVDELSTAGAKGMIGAGQSAATVAAADKSIRTYNIPFGAFSSRSTELNGCRLHCTSGFRRNRSVRSPTRDGVRAGSYFSTRPDLSCMKPGSSR